MTAETVTPKSAGRILHESEMVAAYHKLVADRARLIDLLNRSQNMRPGLLLVLGYVPEPVLEFCNEARALLREMEAQ